MVEDSQSVTGSRANIEDFAIGPEKGKEIFGGMSVHVWSRDCCAISDPLRRVLVCERGCAEVICSIDQGHCFRDSGGGDEGRVAHVGD